MADGYNTEQHMSRERNLDAKKQRLIFTRSGEDDTFLFFFFNDTFLMQGSENENRKKEGDRLSGDLASPNIFVCEIKIQYLPSWVM